MAVVNWKTIEIHGRDVTVDPALATANMEEDNKAEKVRIIMDRYYNGADFDTKEVMMFLFSPDNREIQIPLNQWKTTGDQTLTFDVTFTESMLYVRGYYNLVFKATDQAGYNFSTRQVDRALYVDSNFTVAKQVMAAQYYVDLGKYKTEIVGDVADAETAANNAKTSETNAKASETAAAQSAANALTSEQNAKKSETNAANSAAHAKSEADRVDGLVNGFDQKVVDAKAEIDAEGTKQVGLVTTEGARQRKAVDDEGNAQRLAIDNEGNAQRQLIGNEGTKQVGLVTAEGNKQIANIKAQVNPLVQQAQTAANNAANSEAAADIAETNAKASEDAASDSAIEAEASKTAAAQSAGAAKTSETNAKASETAAASSAAAADGAVKKHVTLDSKEQANFNFCRSEVEQNRLVEAFYNVNAEKTLDYTENKFLQFKVRVNSFNSGWSELAKVSFVGSSFRVTFDNNGSKLLIYREAGGKTIRGVKAFKDGDVIDVLMYQNKDKYFTVVIDNETLTFDGEIEITSFQLLPNRDKLRGEILYGLSYSHPLSPQEIQHNFQVLSNNPSISSIITTDDAGNKSEYEYSTNSYQAVMANGHNLEEAYTGLLSTMGQEFVSADGSEVTVSNAVNNSKVLELEMKGRTQVFKAPKGTQNWAVIPSDEARDTANFDYKLESTEASVSVDGQKYTYYEPTIEGTTAGVAPTDPTLPTLNDGDVLDIATKTITFKDGTKRTLTSQELEAYSHLEKVISLRGIEQTGGTVIGDTLIQKIDGSVVWSNDIYRFRLSSKQNWQIASTNGTITRFFMSDTYDGGMPTKVNGGSNINSNFPVGGDSGKFEREVTGYLSDGRIYIKLLNSEASTVAELETWLSKNEVIVEYPMVNPNTTHIDKRATPTIALSSHTNKISFSDTVLPSSAKVTIPISPASTIASLTTAVTLMQQQIHDLQNP